MNQLPKVILSLQFLLIFHLPAAISQDTLDKYWQRTLGGYSYEGILESEAAYFHDFVTHNFHPVHNESDMIKTPDGGLVVATTAYSKDGDLRGIRKFNNSTFESDAWIVKLNAEGGIEWSRCIGGSKSDYGNAVTVVDDGYIVGGTTESQDGDFPDNPGRYNAPFLAKLDWNGNIVWKKLYFSSDVSGGNMKKVIAGINKGCYMLVHSYDDTWGTPTFHVYNVDSTGVIRNELHAADSKKKSVATNMYKGPEGNVTVVGYSSSDDGYYIDNLHSWQGFLIQASPTLQVDSIYSFFAFNNAEDNFIYATVPGPAGSRYIGGTVMRFNVPSGWVSKRNADGTWRTRTFTNGFRQIRQMAAADDGGVLVTGRGYYANGSNDVENIVVVKLDSLLNIQWTQSYSGDWNEYVYSLVRDNETSYYLMGVTNSITGIGRTHNRIETGTLGGKFRTTDIWVIHAGRFNAIKGSIFFDQNKNGIRESAETLITSGKVQTFKDNAPVMVSSNGAGTYYHVIDTGTYITSVTSLADSLFSIKPSSDTTSFTQRAEVKSRDFAVQSKKDVADARIELLPENFMRPGRDQAYTLRYTNDGSLPLTGITLMFIKDARLSVFNTHPAATTISGDTLRWHVNNLSILNSGSIRIYIKAGIPPLLNLDDTVSMSASIDHSVADHTPDNNKVVLQQAVRSSFDPNDKQELHEGRFSKPAYDAGAYLYYRIRFENTGNDTAFDIQLRDTLSDRLDASTAEVIAASHPYKFSINSGNILVWKFSNIMLPSKQDNADANHGWAYFRIKPRKGLNVGDSVTNRAAIYFDFNLPIITNTQNTVITINKSVITGVNDLFSGAHTSTLRIFPNPVSKKISLSYTGSGMTEATTELFDITGKKLISFGESVFMAGAPVHLSLPSIGKGVYILRVYGKLIQESHLVVVE